MPSNDEQSHSPTHRAAVITVSDRASLGLRPDETGPMIVSALADAGFEVDNSTLVPDDVLPLRDAIRHAHANGARLILTTGGTGIGPRDRTPESVRPLIDLEMPGIIDAISRQPDAPPTALLSRGVAGVLRGEAAAYPASRLRSSLVVTLPGSKGGVRDGIRVILSIAHHAIAQMDGGNHDRDHNSSEHHGSQHAARASSEQHA